MKSILRYLAFFVLILLVHFISCKKDYSCERCGVNKPPLAIAGPDQTIGLPKDSVLLDGSASTDPDGLIVTYNWKIISGPLAAIHNADSTKTVVNSMQSGVHEFQLTVTDDEALSTKDTMKVFVNDPVINKPPVANAGTDQKIELPVRTIILDGSGSTDPENNITAFSWTKISGPSSYAISNMKTVQTEVTSLLQGVYQFELKVTDAGSLFSKDTVNIIVDTLHSIITACDPTPRPYIQALLLPIGNLSIVRVGCAIAAAGNKILFTGGDTITDLRRPTSLDIYDIGTNTWSTTDLSERRVNIGVAVLGNKIYLAGGLIPIYTNYGTWVLDGTSSSVIDIYDAANNRWSTDKLSNPRAPIGASVGDKILFAGGDYFWPSPVVNILNTVSNSWSTATLSIGRSISAVTKIGNRIYFAGGDYNNDGIVSNIDIYDAVSNSWSTSFFSPPFDIGWTPSGIAVGNKNYWAGGQYFSRPDYFQLTNHVEIRDMTTQKSTFACLFQPNSRFQVVLKDNKIVFFTGTGILKNKFDIYDITTNEWSIGVLNQNIEGASIISVNNSIYVAGGYVNGVLSKQLWKLEF